MNFFNDKKYSHQITFLFLFFVALVITTKCLIFFKVNLAVIDSDQPFIWAGAGDYAKGLFYEPRFYGQDYNTFMEGLFAVPLIWFGIPVYIAVPLATHVIHLFPFLFSAFYLFYKGSRQNALLIPAFLLCLTPGYDMLNAAPRGFVTGLFFASFFVCSFLNPKSLRLFTFNILMAVIGFFVNPNSIVVTAFFCVYMLLHNYMRPWFYMSTAVGLIAFIPMYLIFDKFYDDNPSLVIYGLKYDFSYTYFLDSIRHLDEAFMHITPFGENKSVILLILLLVILIASYRQNKKAFMAIVAGLVVVLLSFFMDKTRDGSSWPFYSYSRMFLGIPLMISITAALPVIRRSVLIGLIVPVTLVYSLYKFYNFQGKINSHLEESKWIGVHLVPLKDVLKAQTFYKEICHKNKTEYLFTSTDFWLSTYLAYGGPAVHGDFPHTMELVNERRYMVRECLHSRVIDNFILISVIDSLPAKIGHVPGFSVTALDSYGMCHFTKNTLRTDSVISIVMRAEKTP